MEVRLGDGAVGQGLEGGIGREEKCKPGAVKGLAGMKWGSAGTNQSTREMVDINMVKAVAVFLQKWSDDLLGRVLHGSIGNRLVLVSSPIFPRIHDPRPCWVRPSSCRKLDGVGTQLQPCH
jgi:hypothetical protein